MLQFILSKEAEPDGSFKLEGGDYHYLVNVRRIKTGDEITGVLPGGQSAKLTVVTLDKKARLCELREKNDFFPSPQEKKPESIIPIILFQALPKGTKMDSIVRQATECGVSEIVPFLSERSVRRGGQNIERWQRIVREARQQSGSPVDTAVHPLMEMPAALELWEKLKTGCPALGLLFTPERAENETLGLHGYLADNSIEAVALVTGCEGGFSSQEATRFLNSGFKSAWLGNTVLRAETASVYAISAVRTLLLEKNSWTFNMKE
jgi:16S rRNA (uracil1498-N3)-methyltransferase